MVTHQRKSNKKKEEEINLQKHPQNNSAEEGGHSKWFYLRRHLLVPCVILIVYLFSSKDSPTPVFASQKEKLQLKSVSVPCSKSYLQDISKFKGCIPKQCGRLVTDIVITPEEAAHLLRVSKKGLAHGGSSGGASILDLHSGALSHRNAFINIYEKLKSEKKNNVFTASDFKVYSQVRMKIQQMVAFNFGLQVGSLHLTHPTFFSEMTPRPAMTAHDEYWHTHVDKETYPSFHYTSLLYLTDYSKDFEGGRFVFVGEGNNVTIEPRMGRVSAFTSGAENPHYVEPVSLGTRYALTVSFTCDPDQAISDPSIKKLS